MRRIRSAARDHGWDETVLMSGVKITYLKKGWKDYATGEELLASVQTLIKLGLKDAIIEGLP
jgi:hypothetical protein